MGCQWLADLCACCLRASSKSQTGPLFPPCKSGAAALHFRSLPLSRCSHSSHCSCPMRKSALLARRAPSAAQSTPSLPKSEPEQPVSSERWAHETIYMNPRKKKDGSRDGFLVFTSGKKVVLHNDGGTQISSKTLVPKDELLKSGQSITCLLYTSPSPRDQRGSRMPSSA